MQKSGDPNFDLILSDHPTVGIPAIATSNRRRFGPCLWPKGATQPWPWFSEPRAELGSDSQPILLSNVADGRPAAVNLARLSVSILEEVLTRPGSCGRESRVSVQIWTTWKPPTTDIREAHPSLLLSGGQALYGILLFRWVDLTTQGCRQKSCMLHSTGQATT